VIFLKFLIIFHSVTGNNYILARQFESVAAELGHEVMLRRVEDKVIDNLKETLEIIKEKYDEIKAVDIVKPKEMLDSDVIVMGSPTYFGLCSGPIKLFMDSTCDYWMNGSLFSKKLMAYTTVGDINGGGESCLKAILTYGHHMGMEIVPVKPEYTFEKEISSYGLKHCVGENSNIRPPEKIKEAIKKWIKSI
jgi:NAD(P)H dehydrogenase (quinone)